MTVELFIGLITVLSPFTSMLVEVIKRELNTADKSYSSNLVALISAALVGIIGTAVSYFMLGIEFTPYNILCLPLMALIIWIGSMVGYDKVIQLINQISELKGDD